MGWLLHEKKCGQSLCVPVTRPAGTWQTRMGEGQWEGFPEGKMGPSFVRKWATSLPRGKGSVFWKNMVSICIVCGCGKTHPLDAVQLK